MAIMYQIRQHFRLRRVPLPVLGRDFLRAQVVIEQSLALPLHAPPQLVNSVGKEPEAVSVITVPLGNDCSQSDGQLNAP